ncbi:hypothetical protein ACH5RR_006146 [Cinchona calisaya]|uniref:DUF4408 domain-containing protein n=1 Tax=Cinchona calisaya TaxID=153742 RepID=A0ABD3AN56_9GENT
MNGAIQSTVSCISSLFTPTVLFCILNLIIGTIFITSRLKKKDSNQQLGEDHMVNSSPPQLVRVPSFLDRVKSFSNFSSSYRSEQPDPFRPAAQNADPDEELEKKVEVDVILESHDQRMMEKSVVVEELDDRRRRTEMVRVRKGRWSDETVSFGEDEGGGVDEKADDFINRFRQQLKLQRLNSILRYKEMLNR